MPIEVYPGIIFSTQVLRPPGRLPSTYLFAMRTGKWKAVINFLRQPLADTYHTLVVGFQTTTGQLLIVTIALPLHSQSKTPTEPASTTRCPPRLTGRGGTGHTKNPRALGGEGSFCGQGLRKSNTFLSNRIYLFCYLFLYETLFVTFRCHLSSGSPCSNQQRPYN